MLVYRVTFRGGGPTAASNWKREYIVKATSPHVAVYRAMVLAEKENFRLPKAAWAHLSITRL